MIRALIICTILWGCASPTLRTYSADGRVVPTTIVMAPLCVAICPITVTTSGSDIDTIGGSAPGSVQQTSSVTTGVGN